MGPDTLIRRKFVYLGGYYPQTPEVAFARFQRDLAHFAKTWGIAATASALTIDEHCSRWNVETCGPGWRVETEHVLVRWDDLIDADRQRSWPRRLWQGLSAGADFLWHGAVLAYVTRAWRYALFFLYPFLVLAGFAAVAGALALALPLPDTLPAAGMVRLAGAGLGFAALIAVLGRRVLLDHLLDDWIYSARLLRHGDTTLESRLDRLAQELTSGDGREILIAGHSLGAVHGATLIDRLLAAEPSGQPIRFATLGSSILKIGFHSGAHRLKATLTRITASPRLIWYDFQALNDPMNFYKCEPLASLGLPGKGAECRIVRFRALLSPEQYARIKRNFFRLHSQFIAANDRRARYDYHMMLGGPFALEVWADAEGGAEHFLDSSGRLSAAGHRAATGITP